MMCGMPYLSQRISVPLVGAAATAGAATPLTTATQSAMANATRHERKRRPKIVVIASLLTALLLQVPTLSDHLLAMVAESVNDPVELADALATGRTAVIRVRLGVGNKGGDLAVLCAADADAA